MAIGVSSLPRSGENGVMPRPSWYPERSFRHVFAGFVVFRSRTRTGQARKFGAKIAPR